MLWKLSYKDLIDGDKLLLSNGWIVIIYRVEVECLEEAQTTNAGGVYKNSTQLLPTKDSIGNIIKYREFDIGMTMPRGASRFVASNQMTVYYKQNHNATILKVVF